MWTVRFTSHYVRRLNWKTLIVLLIIVVLTVYVFIPYFSGVYNSALNLSPVSKSVIVVVHLEDPSKNNYGQNYQSDIPSNYSSYIQPIEKKQQIALQKLSEIVQTRIANLQNPSNCNNVPKILCGHTEVCGFGCQIHHRMACLMISFATGFPLIHDDVKNWQSSIPWEAVFLRLGSSCNPKSNNTYFVNWKRSGFPDLTDRATNQEIQYPFVDGLKVPKDIGEKVKELFNGNDLDSFFWWIGQFAIYTLRLQPEMQQQIETWKQNIGFNNPIFGMHVRRTDKIKEIEGPQHASLDSYFINADILFEAFADYDASKRVFIASEDHLVLGEAKNKFHLWEVIGFPSNKTFYSQNERGDVLKEILRDVILLAESDHVICDLQSNVCRLVLALMYGLKNTNVLSSFHLVSLEGKFTKYVLQGGSFQPNLIYQ